MRTVVLDEMMVAYEDEGQGPPLVLIHGHPFNRSMWRPQLDHFSRAGWRVIAPDLRGYGDSTVVLGKTTMDTFARDIEGLFDALEVDKAVLGGLSMGGQIVMEFHRLFPDRIRALVLADTSASAETSDGRTVRAEMADRLVRQGMAPYADEVLPKMVAPHNIEAMPDVAAHVRSMMHTTPPEGAAAALRGRAERPDYVEMLSRVRVPTLVVVGSEDEFTPVAEAQLMHRHLPNSQLAVIHGAAHLPNLERHDDFNDALEVFLRSLSA